MSKTDYAALDAAILIAVTKLAERPFFLRFGCDVRQLIKTDFHNLLTQDQWDIGAFAIDLRLQALRKAGKLAWSSKDGWSITQKDAS